MKRHVARSGTGRYFEMRRIVGLECTPGGIELINQDLIQDKIGRKRQIVRGVK